MTESLLMLTGGCYRLSIVVCDLIAIGLSLTRAEEGR